MRFPPLPRAALMMQDLHTDGSPRRVIRPKTCLLLGGLTGSICDGFNLPRIPYTRNLPSGPPDRRPCSGATAMLLRCRLIDRHDPGPRRSPWRRRGQRGKSRTLAPTASPILASPACAYARCVVTNRYTSPYINPPISEAGAREARRVRNGSPLVRRQATADRGQEHSARSDAPIWWPACSHDIPQLQQLSPT